MAEILQENNTLDNHMKKTNINNNNNDEEDKETTVGEKTMENVNKKIEPGGEQVEGRGSQMVLKSNPMRKKRKKRKINDTPDNASRLAKVGRCYSVVGIVGILLLLGQILITSGMIYLTYLYSYYFIGKKVYGRAAIFLTFAIIYFIGTIFVISNWKRNANMYAKRFSTRAGKSRRSIIDNQGCANIYKLYTSTFISGPFYLWKLYFTEIIESINQLVNVLNLYLCTIEYQWTIVFCFILACDAFFRAYLSTKVNTASRRNRMY